MDSFNKDERRIWPCDQQTLKYLLSLQRGGITVKVCLSGRAAARGVILFAQWAGGRVYGTGRRPPRAPRITGYTHGDAWVSGEVLDADVSGFKLSAGTLRPSQWKRTICTQGTYTGNTKSPPKSLVDHKHPSRLHSYFYSPRSNSITPVVDCISVILPRTLTLAWRPPWQVSTWVRPLFEPERRSVMRRNQGERAGWLGKGQSQIRSAVDPSSDVFCNEPNNKAMQSLGSTSHGIISHDGLSLSPARFSTLN